jgi:hypothetical protein
MYYDEVNERQFLQIINAEHLMQATAGFRMREEAYRGGMRWRVRSGADYLVRTAPDGTQRQLGTRSPETETIYTNFSKEKKSARESLATVGSMMAETERMNRALRVGRCPRVIVAILKAIQKRKLQENFTSIGTTALYGYEALAGVRFRDDVIGVDSRSRSRKSYRKSNVTFAVTADIAGDGIAGILAKADPTFTMDDGPSICAMNASGDTVNIFRPDPLAHDLADDLLKRTHDADAFWTEPSKDMNWLLRAPKLRQVVIGANGRLVEMTVPDPRAFVLSAIWRNEARLGNTEQRVRDVGQARAVAQLIDNHLPQYQFLTPPPKFPNFVELYSL